MVSKYNIFISYRRDDGAQYARILQLLLSKRGYRIFLDYDELTDGIFGENIREAIEDAPVFIAILSPNYLPRCHNEHDWVRNELMFALQLKKHFIFINPDNKFNGIPEGIPSEIADTIRCIDHSEVSFGQALNATIDLLIMNRIVPILGDPYDEQAEKPIKHKSLLSKIKDWIKTKNPKEDLLNVYRPKKVEFDIFISYRRIDGRDHARNIQQALKAHGYQRIFFDYDSLQIGEFNKRIIDAIYSCTDFILVLSPKSMKRCVKNGDPVANEIRTAVKFQKNIIPVTIDGKEVKWPKAFPYDLKFIKGLQFHDHKSDSYFEHSIEELCEKLTCKKT